MRTIARSINGGTLAVGGGRTGDILVTGNCRVSPAPARGLTAQFAWA